MLALIKKQQLRNTTPAIGEHLIINAQCLDNYDNDCFGSVYKAHTNSILHALEALYIKHMQPELCKQIEFVKCLDLFP